jgi:hypothetical protein
LNTKSQASYIHKSRKGRKCSIVEATKIECFDNYGQMVCYITDEYIYNEGSYRIKWKRGSYTSFARSVRTN